MLAADFFQRSPGLFASQVVQRLATDLELAGQCLNETALALGWRHIGSGLGPLERTFSDVGRSRPDLDRRVNDSTNSRSEIEIGAELGSEAEGGKRSTDGLGFSLLNVVTKRLSVFTAPARCRTTFGNPDGGPENGL
jgi:hypothetical protein